MDYIQNVGVILVVSIALDYIRNIEGRFSKIMVCLSINVSEALRATV